MSGAWTCGREQILKCTCAPCDERAEVQEHIPVGIFVNPLLHRQQTAPNLGQEGVSSCQQPSGSTLWVTVHVNDRAGRCETVTSSASPTPTSNPACWSSSNAVGSFGGVKVCANKIYPNPHAGDHGHQCQHHLHYLPSRCVKDLGHQAAILGSLQQSNFASTVRRLQGNCNWHDPQPLPLPRSVKFVVADVLRVTFRRAFLRGHDHQESEEILHFRGDGA